MLHFFTEWILVHSAWKDSFFFAITLYFIRKLLVYNYSPTPPKAKGVGAYSKMYPGMFGLKSKFFPLIILVSETPMMLKSKINSPNKWS